MLNTDKKISKVCIVFENVVYADIDIKYIKRLLITGITKSISYDHNGYSEDYNCSKLSLTISHELADEHLVKFSDTDICEEGLFDRIKAYDDIAYIELHYEDSTKIDVFVPWEDATANGEINKRQKSTDQHKDLTITIE